MINSGRETSSGEGNSHVNYCDLLSWLSDDPVRLAGFLMNKTFLPELPKDISRSAIQSCEWTFVKDYITLIDKHQAIVPLCLLNVNHILDAAVTHMGVPEGFGCIFLCTVCFFVLCTLCCDMCDIACSSVTKTFLSFGSQQGVSLCGCLFFNCMFATQKTEAPSPWWPLKPFVVVGLGAVDGLQTYCACTHSHTVIRV